MRPALGQALRWLQRLVRVLLALLFLTGVGAGALAWRLGQGPLPLPALAGQIERQASAAFGPEVGRLDLGTAALAWAGWRAGAAAPLDIRLDGVRLLGPDGALRAAVPEAAVAVSIAALLRGRLAPAAVVLRRPALLVYREADGSLGLDARAGPATIAGPDLPPVPAGEGMAEPLADLLVDLLRPVAETGDGAHRALRRIRIEDAEVMVVDRALDRRWALADADVDIRRAEAGGLAAEGRASVVSGGLVVPVGLTGRARLGAAAGEPARIAAGLILPTLRPAEIATLLPGLGPLRLVDAPVALSATAEFDLGQGVPARLGLHARAGEGALDLGAGQRLPFAALEAALDLDGGRLRLSRAELLLPGGAAAPRLVATGEARLADGAWTAALALAFDPFTLAGTLAGPPAGTLAGLPHLWPEGLAPGARAAALQALKAGQVREAMLRLTLRAPEAAPEAATLEAAEAALRLEAVVLDLGPLGGEVAAQEIALTARATPDALRIERLHLRLPAPPPRPGATAQAGLAATASGTVTEGPEGWRGALDIALDAPLDLADLPGLWPRDLRPKERRWITRNVTQGTLTGGRWRIEAALPGGADGEGLRITALSGAAEATDAVVHWLRPIPPARAARASARFSLDEIVIRAEDARQAPAGAGRAGLAVPEAMVRFHAFDQEPEQAEIVLRAEGPLPEVFALLRHPRLKLFERRPLEVEATAGQVAAEVRIGFPMLDDLPIALLRVGATGRVTEARLSDVLLGRDLERAGAEVTVDTEGLRLDGEARFVGAPLRMAVAMDFRRGPPGQVMERATITLPRVTPAQLEALDLDPAGVVEAGTVAVEARAEKRRNGQGRVALAADLAAARLAVAGLGWEKPVGTPGRATTTLRLEGKALTGMEAIRVEAPDLALRGSARFGPANRVAEVRIEDLRLAGSRLAGSIARPEQAGGPWRATLRGPLLDLRSALRPGRAAAARDPDGARQPPLALDLRAERVTLGGRGDLHGVMATVRTDARGMLREAQASGRTAPTAAEGGAFAFTLVPHGEARQLRLTAADAGALLAALDLTEAIQGGRLQANASYAELRPGAPLAGTAELDAFVVRDAPALGKLLQAVTLYGMVEAMQGGTGLSFLRAVVPFTLTPEAMTLADARAFSASLGLTAKGVLWRERGLLEMEGTVVPAYFFNQLLGNIPLVGRLFSPEAGGGLFAATYRVQGPVADPSVSVNPLAALTPGFLRGIFGLAEQGAGDAGPAGLGTDR